MVWGRKDTWEIFIVYNVCIYIQLNSERSVGRRRKASRGIYLNSVSINEHLLKKEKKRKELKKTFPRNLHQNLDLGN